MRIAIRPRSGILVLVALAILAGAQRAQAQRVTVEASVSADRVFVGESIELRVSVDGAKTAIVPESLKIDGFDVAFVGSSPRSFTQTVIINGRTRSESFDGVDYSWRLVPQQEGPLTIPSLMLDVGGQRYTTAPIEIRALPPQADGDLRFYVEADQPTPFVGQPITLTVTVAINERNVEGFGSLPEFTFPSIKGPFRVTAAGPTRSNSRNQDLMILGEAVPFQTVGTRIDGRRWTALVARVALVPLREGNFELGPAITSGRLALKGRSFFDRPARRFSVPSNPLTIDVRPLPRDGRPATFDGLVGEYAIFTSAAPTRVNVGDPIELEIRISGPLPQTIEAPDLRRQSGFTGSFRISQEQPEPGLDGRARVFRRTIRAVSDSVSEIPALEIAFFSPTQSSYEVARSAPIPLDVLPTRVVTSADAEGASLELSGREAVHGLGAGIRHNISANRALVDQRFSLSAALRSPLALGALVAPPVAHIALALLMLVRRRAGGDERWRRRRTAASRGRSALEAAADAGELGAALRGYVADRFGHPHESLTSDQCARILSEAGLVDHSGTTATILEDCDAMLFGAASIDDLSSLRSRAREAIDAIERSSRGRRR